MLIIKDEIQKFLIGFPTMSDKYNVAGGILTGGTDIHFGDLVKYSSTTGYYQPATSLSAVTDIAGFVLGTNVKLAEGFPGTDVKVKSGEAFNLLINGYMAIELDAEATMSNVAPNAAAYVILATGKVTTSDKASAETIVELPGVVFTGMKETQGSKKVAEILVK